MDVVKTGRQGLEDRLSSLVLDVLYIAGFLVLAGLTALTARAAAKR